MSAHGTATSYKNGCRCRECRKSKRERIRAYRASKRGELPPVDVPVEVGEGSVVDAVMRDLAELQVAIERPADVAVALAMARLLDDRSATPQHPAAAGKLVDVMASLRVDAKPRYTVGNVTRLREGGKR